MPTTLQSYLQYYERLSNPGYAVLVTGPWGVGKTHQVKYYFRNRSTYYVSLFGVSTSEQTHAAVYATCAPVFSKITKVADQAGKAADSLGTYWAFSSTTIGWINSILHKNISPDRILILDDLERTGLKSTELMGLISHYVEKIGFSVVCIVDENVLQKCFPDYKKEKEKVFGHTIKVQPQIKEALADFTGNLTARVRAFIDARQDLILDIFSSSNVGGLRALRHLLLDIERLLDCLDSNHLNHEEALRALLGLFCPLNIEVRLGNIGDQDLRNRAHAYMLHRMNQDDDVDAGDTNFIKISKKYNKFDLEEQILNDDVLVNALVNGVFDPSEIKLAINQSKYFQEEEYPIWKRLYDFEELDDEAFKNQHAEFQDHFERRIFRVPGEILHAFCLQMLFAEQGIIDKTLEEVHANNQQYISDLLAANELTPREMTHSWYREFDHGYMGYGYWVSNSFREYFEQIFESLINAQRQALEKRYPKFAEELLKKISNDADGFFEDVCHTNNGVNRFVDVPVLSAIDPQKFVQEWLGAHPRGWRVISEAINGRYEPNKLADVLKDECEWAGTVLTELDKAEQLADPLRSFRIRRVIPRKLTSARRDGII